MKKPIWRSTLNPVSSIKTELARVRGAWARYRATNSRDAVFGYLESVFALVTRWQRLNYAVKNSRGASRLQHDAPQMKPEPFGIVIFCTSDHGLSTTLADRPEGRRLFDMLRAGDTLDRH